MDRKDSETRKRIKSVIIHIITFLFIILCLHFFGGTVGSPWSWQGILRNLPLLIIIYLIGTIIKE